WIQLAVVVTFGTLYTVSPKAFSAEAAFEPVPWALGAYLTFTVVRLALSYRFHLPGWYLGLSVVTDMALLLGLIWSFHLQYQQPPEFVLKVPTLLYVFIFIALRALRFEARFVVLAGVVAALGWFGIVGYVLRHDPMITRDYVLYLTSNSVLLGAEFDKIISILVVTTIMALAIVRARSLLVRSVSEGTAVADLSRFFAPEVARQITRSENLIKAGEGQVREAAILNLDLRGFTILAGGIAAGEAIALLAEYQSRMVPVIQRHGGSIDKFLGDGILATFGAALETETYARDALAAVDDVIREAEAWNGERSAAGKSRLRVDAVVATGRIIFGAVGDETRLEYTVIGDAVNLSAKLEKHTKVERVRALATAEAYKLALGQGYRPPAPRDELVARAVAGVDKPIDLVVLAR
ncbi:MAG: adenylate/guanylate cyclase domain-containing protein, partial [Alphaproteobacteria bacterium]